MESFLSTANLAGARSRSLCSPHKQAAAPGPNEGVMKVWEMHYTSHMTRHKHCYEPRDTNPPPGSGTRPLGVTCYLLLVTSASNEGQSEGS